MFEQLGGYFKKESHDTLVLAYSEVPAWIERYEEHISADLAESAQHHVDAISQIVERLQQNLKVLQEKEKAGGHDAKSNKILQNSLVPFIREISEPLSGDLPLDTCRFFTGAETIFTTCKAAVDEHGQILMNAVPVEIAAIKEETHALGRALLGARISVIEKCRAKRQKIDRVKEVLSRIADIEQDSTGFTDRMTGIKGQILETSEKLSRIRSELADLESNPVPVLKQQQETHDSLAAKREEIRNSYIARADIASALMSWARTIATDKNDSYADDVLFEVIQLLTDKDVPDADHLMSTLVCAFPIILDMMDRGDLVPGDDEAGSALVKPADFNNELCRLCREYAAADAQLREVPVGPDALAQKKQRIKDEEARLETQIRDHETAEQDLNTQRMLAARQQWNLRKPLEDALIELIGSSVQIRLNGQGKGGPAAD